EHATSPILEEVDAGRAREGGRLGLERGAAVGAVHISSIQMTDPICFRRANGGSHIVKEAPLGAKRARRSVQAVDRAPHLLEALATADGEVSITALATRTGLHVSTVHRLLSTLLRRGYVRPRP